MPQGLVDQVPDEPSLVMGVALQIRVQAQAADRVPHGVHVLAGDVRFGGRGREVLLDLVRVGVHAGLDVAHVVVLPVPGDPLVVHWARGVEFTGTLAHGAEDLAAVGLVAQ